MYSCTVTLFVYSCIVKWVLVELVVVGFLTSILEVVTHTHKQSQIVASWANTFAAEKIVSIFEVFPLTQSIYFIVSNLYGSIRFKIRDNCHSSELSQGIGQASDHIVVSDWNMDNEDL